MEAQRCSLSLRGALTFFLLTVLLEPGTAGELRISSRNTLR